MGHRFYEATLPKIADQLERLNVNMEALVAELQRFSAPPHRELPRSPPHTDHEAADFASKEPGAR
jgi:hypothetical protein